MKSEKFDILKRTIHRERLARKQAEKILEKKSAELFHLNEKLKETNLKLEDLLAEKSMELQGVFENISDAYVVMDLQGNVLKLNEAATLMFGYNLSYQPLNVLKMVDVRDLDHAFDSFNELYNNGQLSNFTTEIITKDKLKKWIQINASLIYHDKTPIAAQGIIRDITELKQSTELIENQKSQLEIIFENSSLGIVLTQGGNIIQSNKAFEEFLGYKKDKLLNRTLKDLISEQDMVLFDDYILQMSTGKINNFKLEKRYVKKNGSLVWANTKVNAVRNLDGSIKYLVALIEDITKEREKALSVEVLNEVAKAVIGKIDVYEIAWEIVNTIGKYLGTKDCVIYILNRENQELEQIAALGNKALGRSIVDKISIPIGSGIVGTVAKSGIPELIMNTSMDSRYIVDDDVRLSEITVPIFFENEVIGVIDSEHVDENFYTEEHLKALQNISHLVAIQLNNAIIQKEKKKAEKRSTELMKQLHKSNEELQEYAHIVSHDLKSPLRSIHALVSWLKEDNQDNLTDESITNFELIETTVERMENLITDILDYSSVNNNLKVLEPVYLNRIIDDLILTLFVPKHIEIKVNPKLPLVYGESVKFKQLFQNLISNAVKFIEKKEGIVEVGFLEEDTEYTFYVKDNGIGVEEKYHDQIFKIFGTLNKNKNSTGIGLSIVKKIIDLYKGKIWLESKPNLGSTFYFTIPKRE